MKSKIYLLSVLLMLFTCISYGQKKSKKDTNLLIDTFVLEGKVIEVDMFEDLSRDAPEVHVIVYQEKEIFVAFFTQKDGTYEFHLPYGHQYEIWYGGSSFLNKKVAVDTKKLVPGKQEMPLKMDIALFRPVDGYEFELLNEPYVNVNYDETTKTLVPDIEFTEIKADELSKLFRKIKKEQGKKSKANM